MTHHGRMRTLRPGEPVPDWPPMTRSIHTNGYVLLLWLVGPNRIVRTYEHRAVMGNPAEGEVHHKNGIKTDNRLENLEVLSGRRHRQSHASWDIEAAAKLYDDGLSCKQIARRIGVLPENVFRSLRTFGVTFRSFPNTGARRRKLSPPEPDGEAFRGREAAAYDAERMAEIQRMLK